MAQVESVVSVNVSKCPGDCPFCRELELKSCYILYGSLKDEKV